MGRVDRQQAAVTYGIWKRIAQSVDRLGDPVLLLGFLATTLIIALFVLYPVIRVVTYPSSQDFVGLLDHPQEAGRDSGEAGHRQAVDDGAHPPGMSQQADKVLRRWIRDHADHRVEYKERNDQSRREEAEK